MPLPDHLSQHVLLLALKNIGAACRNAPDDKLRDNVARMVAAVLDDEQPDKHGRLIA